MKKKKKKTTDEKRSDATFEGISSLSGRAAPRSCGSIVLVARCYFYACGKNRKRDWGGGFREMGSLFEREFERRLYKSSIFRVN